MSMRSKALENIRAVMEHEDNTYRRENGYEEASWESFRPEPLKPKTEGNFLAGRFLGVESIEPIAKPEPEREPEELHEPEPSPEPKAQDTEPEFREVIPRKDGKHSWLYNEVLKAINDAARENTGTKVIAVLIPVLQNGKEFEELPVDAAVSLSPVSEEDIHVEGLLDAEPEASAAETLHEPPAEQAAHVDDIIPETPVVPDPELVEAFQTMEEKLDSSIAEESHEEEIPDAAEEPTDGLQLDEPQLGDEAPMEFVEEEPAAELLPLPDPAEIVADLQEGEALSFIEDEEEESKGEPMIFVEQPEEDEEESRGEPMAFEDIPIPEGIPMPDGLDDDEIEIQDDDKLSL